MVREATVSDRIVEGYVVAQTWRRTTWERAWDTLVGDESGEGVISAAIAVLIMAFLGAAAWLAFSAIFDDATESTRDQVERIGS
jgi:hypothetical protein